VYSYSGNALKNITNMENNSTGNKIFSSNMNIKTAEFKRPGMTCMENQVNGLNGEFLMAKRNPNFSLAPI
jgi:hypothetical protein